jgi:hypothetical protein
MTGVCLNAGTLCSDPAVPELTAAVAISRMSAMRSHRFSALACVYRVRVFRVQME